MQTKKTKMVTKEKVVRRQGCARWMTVPKQSTEEAFANHTEGNHVWLMAAAPTQLREACAVNMAQWASAVSATAAPTQQTKVAFVRGTVGKMGFALHQVVSLLLFLAKVCAPSTAVVATGNHVRLMAAPPTHKREDCARNMAHTASAVSTTAAPT